MLVDILVFRFFLKNSALETVGWLGFFFLQVLALLPPSPKVPFSCLSSCVRALEAFTEKIKSMLVWCQAQEHTAEQSNKEVLRDLSSYPGL